jgi:hypothetical protein
MRFTLPELNNPTRETCVCYNSKVECLSLALGEFNIVERLRDPHRGNTESAIVLEWAPITSGAPHRLEGSEPNLAPQVCIIIALDWDRICQFRTREPKRGPSHDGTESSFER